MSNSKWLVATKKALSYLEENNLPCTTVNMSVWQNYYLAENKALIQRMRAIQKSGQAFNETILNTLYEDFVLRQHLRKKMGLDSVLDTMLEKSAALQNHIKSFCAKLEEKQKHLQTLRKDLSEAEVKEVINFILRQALEEMDEIEQEAKETELWLGKGSEDLQLARKVALKFEMNLHSDYLTGVPDQQFFRKEMEKLLSESFSGLVRRRKLLVFYIKELDHYNETYSWLLGDSVIRQVTRVIQEQLSAHPDWQIMRYGGASFVVLPAPSAVISSVGIFIQEVIKSIKTKSLIIKNTQQKIKPISLCALLVPYEVFDSLVEVEAKIELGLVRFKALADGAEGVVLDLSEEAVA